MLLEPLFGSFIGYFFGMQNLPDLYTLTGGCVLLLGLLLVILGENNRQKHEVQHFARNNDGAETNELLLQTDRSEKVLLKRQMEKENDAYGSFD